MTRSRRTVAATVVALALLVGAGVAAVEIIAALAGGSGWFPAMSVTRWAAATSWDSVVWRLGSAAVAVCGLWLVLLAVLPGHGRVLRLRSQDDAVLVGTTRRSVRHVATAAADRVDGVESASARLRGRALRVTARTRLTDPKGLTETVRTAAEERLGALAPARPFHVTARIRPARRGAR